MSGDRHDVDSEIVLPAGMEHVVPPPARDPASASGAGVRGNGASAEGSGDAEMRVIMPPFARRGHVHQAPAI